MEKSYLAQLAVERLIRVFLHVKRSLVLILATRKTDDTVASVSCMLQREPMIINPRVDHPVRLKPRGALKLVYRTFAFCPPRLPLQISEFKFHDLDAY